MANDGGYLTTHVLDTARGVPAADLRVDLVRLDGERREPLGTFETNIDGRTDRPVLAVEDFAPGTYELVFHAGDYLSRHDTPANAFLDIVPIRFTITDSAAHYHVPLLLSPYSYATYRGS